MRRKILNKESIIANPDKYGGKYNFLYTMYVPKSMLFEFNCKQKNNDTTIGRMVFLFAEHEKENTSVDWAACEGKHNNANIWNKSNLMKENRMRAYRPIFRNGLEFPHS